MALFVNHLAMVNGNYSLAESYLSTAISLILGNPILKGSALETRIQAVHNEIIEVQNGYVSVQPASQINLGFDSNQALSSEIEIEKHLNHLGNKLDDYHKSYYKDSDHRKGIYIIHEKISKGEGIETQESQEYLEHIFEHDNQYRKEQITVLSTGINAYNELKKIRPLLDSEKKELKHFSNRLSRIQTDFKVYAKFSDWLASTLGNVKDFDIIKEHVLQNSSNTEYIEKLTATIDKIQKNKKTEKRDSILIEHKEDKTKSELKLEALKETAQNHLKDFKVSQEKLEHKNIEKETHGHLTPPTTPNVKKGEQQNNKNVPGQKDYRVLD